MSKKVYEAPEVNIVNLVSQNVISLTLSSLQTSYKNTSAKGIGSADIIEF